jgi:pimeloyl-ACP methyl ester carboxylesterase/predicted glycosyltransferase
VPVVTRVTSRTPPDASRARHPDATGVIRRDGVRVYWERYGTGSPTVLLLPTWSVFHSRHWKAQIPELARHYRVLTFDGRGNGHSDRPLTSSAYADTEFVADALAVLDADGTEAAVVAGLSMGAGYALRMAAEHPDRVLGLVCIGSSVPILDRPLDAEDPIVDPDFHAEDPSDDDWAMYNAHVWRRDWPGFAEWFTSRKVFSEPHSTKPIEDAIGWMLETDPETIIRAESAPYLRPPAAWGVLTPGEGRAWPFVRRVRCPALVIHGEEDRISPIPIGEALAAALDAPLVRIAGGGHAPNGRWPVEVNLAIRAFVDGLDMAAPSGGGRHAAQGATRAAAALPGRRTGRPPRVLFVSSPIGLGHAQRDVAIAAALRAQRPDLEIDWLAQHPVTAVLEGHGERIHPASTWLASESTHIASEASGHELNAFQAIRRMDEILVANFMVLHEVVAAGEYDVVIGDEAWEVDHYLHEHPALKRTAFAWLTDFVGWLPMPAGGEREALLTADYNAEMIEHVERFPRVRDRAIFVGDPEDVVPDDFGPGMPGIREWTERHYAFAGYVTGFDPQPLITDRAALRRDLGYRDDERVVIVTVGGSGVGEALLRRVVAAYPEAARQVNGLRMIVVAGPRIDPASLAAPAGVEVRAFVPDLYRHLAACDLAVVQGGLTTTMELVAARRPFLYFPLANHFEQNRHVRHRLERYGAGRCMDYAASPPEAISAAIAEEIDRPVAYGAVTPDGAARAAALIAPLL